MVLMHDAEKHLIDIINKTALPVSMHAESMTALLHDIGDARFVLLGEASHGTEDFYQARIAITKRLISEKGFMAVSIEGDWPDVYAMNQYVKGYTHIAEDAFRQFIRFPTWMWRNTTIPPFLDWLRAYNDTLPAKEKIGIYGLDLYSMYSSMQSVIDYLKKVDPVAAARASERYACFDHIKDKQQDASYINKLGVKKSCMEEVITQLLELQKSAQTYLRESNQETVDDYFQALQNARLVRDAEKYYRILFEGKESSWNVRDQHMFDAFHYLAQYLESQFQRPAKIIVWAHNSHVGDAR